MKSYFMNKNFLASIFFVAFFMLSSCEKGEDIADGELVTQIVMPSGSKIFEVGEQVTISGKGFTQGDRVFLSNAVRSTEVNAEATVVTISDNQIIFIIPEDMSDGQYTVILRRGNEDVILGTITIGTSKVDPPIPNTDQVLYLDGVAEGKAIMVLFTDGSSRTANYAKSSGIIFTESEKDKTLKGISAEGLNNGSSDEFADRTTILIGRKASECIRLSFDNGGSLQLRAADVDGYRNIGSFSELQLICKDATTCAGKYRQEADIDLMSLEWRAIQYYVNSNTVEPFTGVYDGDDHTIANLKIDKFEADCQGLFGKVSGGTIQNVKVISGNVKGNNYVGGICGKAESSSEIVKCSNSAKINGRNYIGGIVGTNQNSNLTDCFNTATISADSSAGGVSGSGSGIIKSCYNTGAVSGTSVNMTFVGGVVGSNSNSLIDCYNSGTVSGKNDIGGVTAYNSGSINNCSNSGKVSGTSNYTYAGGIAGNNYGLISDSHNTGTISGDFFVGGVTGKNAKFITNCHNEGGVSGGSYVSGLVGENFGGDIIACYNSGNIYGNRIAIGGVVGRNDMKGTVTACYNTNTVSGSQYVGGIAGENSGSTTSVKSCYNTGKITASVGNYGGVVGFNHNNATVELCYWRVITGGASAGVGTTDSYTSATRFSGTDWPLSSMSGWGIGNPTDNGEGYYWKNLGSWNNGAPVFPKLWWE